MTTATAPSGVLLGTFEPGTPEWEEARGGLCITATEIAAVLGLSPWQSRFSLWHKKAGLPSPPFETKPEMEWGSRLEPAVAQKYADEHPELTLTETGTWRHAEREWQRATPDRIADDRLVEIKTSPWGDGWGPDGDDDGVPIYYRCQAMWQMDTLGYRRTDFAVLISGHDYRRYTVWFDEVDAELMRDMAQTFLHDVEHGNRPPIDDSEATYQTIRRQPEGLEDIDVEIPVETADRYENAQIQAKAAEAELTGARSQLLDLIGSGKRAVVGQRRIAYRTVRNGQTHALMPYRQKDTQ